MNDIENNMMKNAIHADKIYYSILLRDLLLNIALICDNDNINAKACDLIHYELECDRLHDKVTDDNRSMLLSARQDCIDKRHTIACNLFR